MLIVTPLLQGETIAPEVAAGVARIAAPWLVVSSPAAYPNYPREYSVNHTRAILQVEAIKLLRDHETVLLLDSDVVLPEGDFLGPMTEMLERGFVAAALRTKPDGYTSHVVCACALMHVDVYSTLLRYMDHPHTCQCQKLATIGRVGYVDGFSGHEINR